ncbi:MAG: M16 family metallopeptidase [Janthinobacterium lividum]
MTRYFNSLAAAAAMLLTAAASHAATPAPPASPYGQIVSQTFDKAQSFTETHLANGLTILSKESHAAPVAYFSVWYKVGSRNEISGQTGLSHILEHMMFKGTTDLPPGAIDHLFLTNGGQINASTAEDRTEYHELIASDRLELAARIEADRMENSKFDPTELSHEMVVVRSELEGDGNSPGYDLYTNTFLPAAFSAHPYHWPVIGWRSDVEAVQKRRDVIYAYYKHHYMPNNAVVVMVGDFDTKKAVGIVQKYFGVYPAGHLEQHFITPEPTQRGERRVVLQRSGTTGQVLIGYHVPETGQPDHYVLDVMSTILSGGRSARLYQNLVEKGIAQSASGGDGDNRDPYLMTFDGTPSTGVTNATVETALEVEITKLQTTPVTAEELARAIRQTEAGFVYQNDSVSEQADTLGRYAVINLPRYNDTYLDKIRAVTPADIQRVAKQYLIADNRTVAYFDPQPLPPGQTPPPPPVTDNFGSAKPVTDPRQKALLDALDTKFNSVSASTAKPAAAPKPTRVVLPNGMVLIVQENHANKTVAMDGFVRAGSMFDPEEKYSDAEVTAAMLSRGTTTKSALQLALTLESVGAGVSINAETESASLSGTSLSKDFGLTLSTLADELQNPSFPPDQLERLRAQILSGIEDARQDTGGTGGAGTQAEIAFAQAIYPKGHPFWEPSLDESAAAVKSLTRADLETFYQTYYRPDTTALVVVGDVNTQDVINQVKAAFSGWAKPSSPAPSVTISDVGLPATPPAPIVIPLADAPQTSILFGYNGGLTQNSPEYYAVQLMNYTLGGDTFGSRLGKTIRDQNGLAYSVSSGISASHGSGPFQIFIGANPKNATRAITYLRQIITQEQKYGVTPDEVRQAKLYITGSYPLRLETNAGVAGVLSHAEDFGLGLDFPERRNALFNAVTPAQVSAAAKKYLHPGSGVLVIAGAVPQ